MYFPKLSSPILFPTAGSVSHQTLYILGLAMPWSEHVYQYDGQGNTTALVDETSTVTDTFTYDAWGNQLARTGTTKTPFRWNGRVGYHWDEGSGTYQVRRRPYQNKTASFITKDPLPDLIDINPYTYALQNPINRIDPSGLQSHFSGLIPWFLLPIIAPSIQNCYRKTSFRNINCLFEDCGNCQCNIFLDEPVDECTKELFGWIKSSDCHDDKCSKQRHYSGCCSSPCYAANVYFCDRVQVNAESKDGNLTIHFPEFRSQWHNLATFDSCSKNKFNYFPRKEAIT